MATSTDIIAYIGAAAWLPQIASWVYGRFVTPIVRLIPERQISIGFTALGPIVNIRASIGADRKAAIIEHMTLQLMHEHGDTHEFEWTSLSETFSEITDSAGNRQKVERDQPAIAIKIDTSLLQERFVRFQDHLYHERRRANLESVFSHQSYLFEQLGDRTKVGIALLSSREMHQLLEFHRSEFWWKPGRYTVTFKIKSSNRARLKRNVFTFDLNQSGVDLLQRNTSTIQSWYSNSILGGTSDYELQPISWNWQEVPLLPSNSN